MTSRAISKQQGRPETATIEHYCPHCSASRCFRWVRDEQGKRRWEVYYCQVCNHQLRFAVA